MNRNLTLISLFLLLGLTQEVVAQDHAANILWLKHEKEAESNTVLLHNEKDALPFVQIEHLAAASVNLGAAYSTVFNTMLNKYAKVDTVKAYPLSSADGYVHLNDDLKLFQTVIFQLSSSTIFDQRLLDFLLELEKTKKIVVVISGKNDPAAFFNTLTSPVLWCNRNTPESASVLAQMIFGGIGLGDHPAIRLKYTVPEEAGINQFNLDSITTIMKEAIAAKAAPGGVVMILKDGKVIFCNAFGKQTYTGTREMRISDIFDMASLTKTSATTLEVMQLVEQGKLSLDSTISKYIARTRSIADKRNIRVKEVMLHEAGFTPFIAFYKDLKPEDMSTVQSDQYPTEVADNYFLRANYYKDIMWPAMLQSKIITRGKFVYSDLSMYYMKEIVEKVTGIKMNDYLDQHFYFPLGMQTGGFLPRKRFNKDRIVPTTENDGWFRNMLVQGFVDDPGAAMAGGVSGHAGFFAVANDLAILYQMLLNKGTYGGQEYFKTSTVELFTSGQSKVSRRGLGFDRKDPDPAKGYPSFLSSSKTFGHTGYTGTAVWVDPAYNLVYIFLSNRVYPDVKSDALLKMNIRSRIQDVIYRAIKNGN